MQMDNGCGHKPMQRIVEVCLLVMLCGPDCEHCHGYALGERLRDFGFSDSEISVSTLYRTLRGMEEAGWVTSGWAEGGPGPQRREYAVTDAGRNALDAWASVLQQRRERITRVLDEYAQLGREPAVNVSEEELLRGRSSGARTGERHHRVRNDQAQRQESTTENKPMNGEAQQKQVENLHEYWD